VSTFEHVLPVSIQDAGPRLQVLAPEKLGEGYCDGVGGTRDDGLRLASLWWPMLVLVLLGWLAALLLLHGLHPGLLFLGLLLEVLDELRNGHASFLGIASQLLLHRHDLLPRGHLTRDGHARWWLCLHLGLYSGL
jgi:hypothetical protein